jgi:hypothetical protein
MPSVSVKQLFSLVLALRRASTLDFLSFGPYLTLCAVLLVIRVPSTIDRGR